MASRPELIAFAERIETKDANEANHHMVLLAAFESVKGPIKTTNKSGITRYHDDWFAFNAMLNVAAYESAALTLIPAGRRMAVQQRRSYEGIWVSFTTDARPTNYDATGKAASLALAIVAAALRLASGVEGKAIAA